MQSVSPVFDEENVQYERVIALTQSEYLPIIAIPINFEITNTEEGTTEVLENHAMAVRFRFTDDERALIAAGADLVVTEIVFAKLFTPINIQLLQPGEKPAFQ